MAVPAASARRGRSNPGSGGRAGGVFWRGAVFGLAQHEEDPALQAVQRRDAFDELLIGGRRQEQRAVEHEIVRILTEIAKFDELESMARSVTRNVASGVRAIGRRKHVLLVATLGAAHD